MSEKVNHPNHYGGDTKYEAIKLIEDWGLGFSLGNALKYIVRAGRKDSAISDLEKAAWYLQHAYAISEPRLPPHMLLSPIEAAAHHNLDHNLAQALIYLGLQATVDAPNTPTGRISFVEASLHYVKNEIRYLEGKQYAGV